MADQAETKKQTAAWRFLVPNLFTACSVCLGIASVVMAIEGLFYWSAWAIIWCALLDKLDGTAARLLHATSRFGTEFDSLADLISFGIAPSALVYAASRDAWGIEVLTPAWWLLVVGCGLYALMAAIRLARYNVVEAAQSSRYFSGLPSTFCGAIVPCLILVAMAWQAPIEVFRFMPAVMVLLGLGMVSHLPVPKVKIRRNKFVNVFQLVNIVAGYICGFATIFPEYLLGLLVFYLSVGVTYGLIRPPQRVSESEVRAD